MTIKQFIQKAIEGGWKPNDYLKSYIKSTKWNNQWWKVPKRVYSVILLDPSAWQAVGKVEKWDTVTEIRHGNWDEVNTMTSEFVKTWEHKMHQMIDALIEGKSIEEFIKTL